MVELLVVAAVVGIAMALLLPALALSKDKAKRAKCENQLHQFYAIAVMYANDHEGYLGRFEELLRQVPLICPNDSSHGEFQKGFTYRLPTSYWASSFYFANYSGGRHRRLDSGTPESILLCEYQPYHDPSKKIGFEPDKWKGRFLNLMADGKTAWPLLEQ